MPTRRAYTYTKQYLLRSNLATVLLLTLLFLYTSWLYRGLKRQADLERHLPNQLHSSSHAFTTTTAAHSSDLQQTAAGAAVGRLVGSQLTHVVQAGSLFSWGLDNSHRTGRLGGDNTAPQLTLPHLQVLSVAASRHSLFVTADGVLFSMGPNNSAGGGQLWVWGYDGCTGGQLPEQREAWRPRRVAGQLANKKVVAFDVGYTFWLAATADGELYTCDNMDDGYAGTLPQKRRPHHAGQLGRAGTPHQPGRVDSLTAHRITAVAAGREHALAATSEGQLFSWGGSRAVLGRDGEAGLPGLVQGALAGKLVKHVAAGEYFSLAATDSQVFAWGSNAYLCLGTGNASVAELLQPAAVAGTLGAGSWQIKGLIAGYQHAFAIADKPGDEELLQLMQQSSKTARAAASAGTVVGSSVAGGVAVLQQGTGGSGVAGIEVILTEKQQQEREQLLQQQQQQQQQQYNTQHRNPCWGGLGPGLSCLPYFNIIGVSKCGTTDLYHRLTLHKQILAATNKGPHFWDECPHPPAKGGCTAGPSGDFQAYINLFSRAADLIRSRPDAIAGEASSNTFTSANGVYLRGFRGDKPWADWAGSAGLNASMPALLREAQPYLRLIVMLRDPVDRYYSAYHYYKWWEKEERQPTADDFHAHALREMQQWRDCVAAADLATCVRRYNPQQLVKGMYSQFLQDWLVHFLRHQLLLLRYEDYKAALPQHLEAVLQFLDVSPPETASWQAMLGAAVQNTKSYPPMRHDTRELLREFYAPFNRELADVLQGDCRWLWLDRPENGG
ncbi:hypothetical protein OEZ85_014020 [Tetradesmus obliquus]|uniref:Sulfotransferase domain-containing protein n=1 Tax=Tetradesmus obliquus TaxID=3088 RepID=A0ABY8U774_TETOB|nr:hypothetical protein OEZ85_014020 [Tetradesmus obliquus]